MSEVNFVQSFAAISVKVDGVEAKAKGMLEVSLTIGQYGKLMEVLPDTKIVTVKGSRIIAAVFAESLATAVANHVKAPRTSGAGNVTIKTRTVYTVEAPDATNKVTSAFWDSEDAYGELDVNENTYTIQVGRAEDFYEIGDDGNPDRPVFFLDLVVESDKGQDEIQLTSYSVMNLIKRVTSVRASIIG